MKKTVLLIVAFFLFASFSSVFAEMKTFIKEYTYQAGEIDSKISCRIIALEQVKRLLLEEIGTYLESQTEVKNFRLTKDEITVLTAGIVRAEIIEERWDGNTLKYWLKAKITADPSSVVTSIDSLRKDRLKTKELESIRQRSNDLNSEIEQLRKELIISKNDREKLNQYNRALKQLSAYDFIERGVYLVKKNRLNDAIEAFRTAIEIDPSIEKSYSYLAAAYFENSKYHLAVDYATKAIQMDPNDELAYQKRGAAYFKLRKYKNAVDDLSKTINISPNNADVFSLRGQVFIEEKNYKMAVKDFSKAIELAGSDGGYSAQLYEKRGFAYEKLGDYKKASDDYGMAVFYKGPRPMHLRERRDETDDYERGVEHILKGQHKQALKALSKAIKFDPNDIEAIEERGDVYFRLGNYKEALKDYTKAIAVKYLDPTNIYMGQNCDELFIKRADVYWKLGQYERSMADKKIALSTDLEDCIMFRDRERDRKVIDKCIKTVEANPQKQTIEDCSKKISSISLAMVYSNGKEVSIYSPFGNGHNLDRSAAFFSKVIEVSPIFASMAYCDRAEISVIKKQYLRAIEDYSMGIKLDLDYPQNDSVGCVMSLSRRGRAYYLSGQYERAIQDYSKEIELYPLSSNIAHSSRGDVYMKLRKYEMAIHDYSKAIETSGEISKIIETSDKMPISYQQTFYRLIYRSIPEFYAKRGDAHRENNDYQKAVEDYTSAIDLSVIREFTWNLRDLYGKRGDVNYQLGNNNEALQDYSKIIESYPQNAVALRKRGTVYNKLGRHKLAVDDLRMAATLGDGDAQDYLRKSEINW